MSLLLGTSIAQIAEKFINRITEVFAGEEIVSLERMEQSLTPQVQACVCELAVLYIEELDARLLADKGGRRDAGYCVERRDDERSVLTSFGELSYKRTYYNCGQEGYAYLADKAVGLESYERVSAGVSLSLCSAAREMSYAKSSNYATGGAVSRQTVMHKVRECQAVRPPEPKEKRRVNALHIDADEAHITLCGGKKSIVPLISVYEGIEKQGKRHSCKNIFHISEYGKTPDELWEQALSEVETLYELDSVDIYLHGDGAAWVKRGLEWFSGAKFVLDKYHKNKEITAMTAGLDKSLRKEYQVQIRYALAQSDSRFFLEVADSLVFQMPQREENIRRAAGYLNTQIEGVAICFTDPEANNGGCTEPHVSHVLSSRLSSRPMAWSKATLTQLAPVLAKKEHLQLRNKSAANDTPFLLNAARAASNAFKRSPFLPNPDSIGNLQPTRDGKVTRLYETLKGISKPLSLF